MGAELENLDGFGNEQPVSEPQIQQPPEPPGEESGDEGFDFTQVRLEDINRDDLSPEMQVVYDDVLERASNMQADYTRKTQELAAIRRDAETWRMVAQHPELSRVMNEALYRIDQGLPVRGEQQQSQQPVETPDPNTDPMGFLDNRIETKMRSLLQEFLPPLQQGIQQVTGDMQQRQAALEYNNLSAVYPGAKAVGFDELNRTRSQYRDSTGRPVSMETALHILSQGNPALVQKTQMQPKPKPKNPPVEQPKQQRGSTVQTPLPEGIRKLQADVEARRKDGSLNDLGAAVRRVFDKFRQ
jgi:hypothetical protein